MEGLADLICPIYGSRTILLAFTDTAQGRKIIDSQHWYGALIAQCADGCNRAVKHFVQGDSPIVNGGFRRKGAGATAPGLTTNFLALLSFDTAGVARCCGSIVTYQRQTIYSL